MIQWSDLNPEEILGIAVILERDGRAFYREAAGRSRDVTGRAMFEYLEREEERHLKLFRSELKKLAGGEGDPTPDEERRLRKLGGVLEVFSADRGINPGMDDTDVLRAAAAIEKEVYLFYRRSAVASKSKETQEVLERLSDEEWGHYQSINTILSGLTETGEWISYESVRVPPAPSGGEWSLEEWKSGWSIEVGSLYTCEVCGSMLMVTKGGVGTLAPECCGRPMLKTSTGHPGVGR